MSAVGAAGIIAMKPLPTQLADGISISDGHIVNKWWSLLAKDDQAEISSLYDPRQDSCKVRAKQITILVDSELLCDDEADMDDWADFFDYMLGHPEIFPLFEARFRSFHIGCLSSSHAGHRVVETVPAGFLCPFNSPVCPFRR
jgi:hypothetical protein